MTVLSLRLTLSSAFQEKLSAHFFDKTANDYVINYMTSYLSQQAEHPLL